MRPYQRLKVELRESDRKQVEQLLRGGSPPVRVVKRAQVLRLLGEGQSSSTVGHSVGLGSKAVREIGRRYEDGGLERALYDRPRPGAKPRLSTTQRQRVIAMVCTPAPEGRARWTVTLVLEEAVKRKLIPRVSRETIRLLLHSHELKPWREKNVVRGGTGRRVHRQDGRRVGRL